MGNMFSLSSKTAMVIGAAGNLGPMFCDALAAAGANLVMADIEAPESDARAIAARHGVKAKAVALDLRDSIEARVLIDKIDADFGPIDILHVNAATKGASLPEFFAEDEDYGPDVWREIMSVNLDGLFFAAVAAGRHMVARKRGSVILTTSIYGLMAPDQRIYEGSDYLGMQIRSPAAYSASKAGVVGLTRHLASLWGAANVRVNAIAPGGVGTGQNTVFHQRYSERVPMGRMARPDEMSGALIFLAADASSYMTGQILTVDGGLSCW